MKRKGFRFFGFALVARATTASAQTETLTFNGGALSGTFDSSNYDRGVNEGTTSGTFRGNISGSLTLSKPLPSSGTTTVDPIGGSFSSPIDSIGIGGLPAGAWDVPSFALPTSVTVTTKNGLSSVGTSILSTPPNAIAPRIFQ
jgi:hypothetical protein